jgi:hypothetical protein
MIIYGCYSPEPRSASLGDFMTESRPFEAKMHHDFYMVLDMTIYRD